MARVGPRWRHRGILHRPGRGQMAPQRVVASGWVGFVPQPRGRSMLFAAGLPPKQSSCFCIDLEINVQ